MIIRDHTIRREILQLRPVHTALRRDFSRDVRAGELLVSLHVHRVEAHLAAVAHLGVDQRRGESRMVAVGLRHAHAHHLEKRCKLRCRCRDVLPRIRLSGSIHTQVFRIALQSAARRETGDDFEVVFERIVEHGAVFCDHLRLRGRCDGPVLPHRAVVRAESDEVGESNVFESRNLAATRTPHDHRHAWRQAWHDLQRRGLLRGVVTGLKPRPQDVFRSFERRVQRILRRETLSGRQIGHDEVFVLRTQIHRQLRARHCFAPQIGHHDLNRLRRLHAPPHLPRRRDLHRHALKTQHAVADAHLIDQTGESAVVAAQPVAEAQLFLARNHRAEAFELRTACRRAIAIKLPLARTIIREGHMLPHVRFELEGLRVNLLRLRAKAQRHKHPPQAGFVRLADLPLVVRVIDVLLVEQVAAQLRFEFRLSLDPHLHREGPLHRFHLHQSRMSLVLHRKPRE